MSKGIGTPTPTEKLIYRLRLMADAGGILTRDRIRTLIEAADRLDDLMTELPNTKDDGGDSE